ncbi:MAG: transposase [Candidatus Hydrothermae bacterium]|nr:transposase [Candidatus Hydrothermae bacterium]
MLKWAIEEKGIKPEAVVMDAWYGSKKILKYLQEKGVRYMTRVKKNRKVKIGVEGEWVSVEDIGATVPKEGMVVILHGVGPVKLFALSPQTTKNGGQGEVRYYISNDLEMTRDEVEGLIKKRWQIEEVFRILKSVFSLDKFFVRTAESILGFFAVAFLGFMLGERLRVLKGITHYQLQKRLRQLGRKAFYHNPLFSI